MKLLLMPSLFLLMACQNTTSSESTPLTTSFLSGLSSRHTLPGVGSALIQDGQYKNLSVTGVRKYGAPDLITTTDTFHLGSCTKAMTATLAAMMVEEGKLNWNSTLSELFPELNVHADLQNVTFDMLLAHRSGLTGNNFSATRALVAKNLLESAPEFSPGTYNYSNAGYIIVGHILEKLGHDTWEALISDRLFSPLDMSSCGFGVNGANEPWGHQIVNGILKVMNLDNMSTFGPAGTVRCSMNDWGKFLQMHLKGFNGESGLLSVASFQKLHTLYPASGSVYTYGGWMRVERAWAGGPALTHAGSNTYNYSNVWIAPRKKAVLMSVTNVGGDDAFQALDETISHMIKEI